MEILRKDKNHLLDAIHIPSRFDGPPPDIKFQYISIPSGEYIVLGSTKDGTNTQGFLKYLDLLKITVEETTCAEIVEIFDLMHPWDDMVKEC